MKPVRRRIRRHFGHTLSAKRVTIRTHRPWYFQAALSVGFVLLGAGITYWFMHDSESDSIRQKLQQLTQDNKALEVKLVGVQRELQVELATNNNLAKELASVHDENLKIKEDLMFYKNMVERKKGR
ncbi:MAG TPA: hypothetical protein PLR90_00045 [Methylophilus sp.]|nr:hypothetical protein [Methylophilus sp.]HQQ32278.1 hypothetical protein [Methylophilus sp.]